MMKLASAARINLVFLTLVWHFLRASCGIWISKHGSRETMINNNHSQARIQRESLARTLSASPRDCNLSINSSTFIPEDEMYLRQTPILLSLPGSGNSWTRMLIEIATGHLTGSLEATDGEYKSLFAGEKYCGIRLVAVKGHPKDVEYNKVKNAITFIKYNKVPIKKCGKGQIKLFTRAIIIIRNPLQALWSYYQLYRTRSHTGFLMRESLNISDWKNFSVETIEEWSNDFRYLLRPVIETWTSKEVIVVRYEDLCIKHVNKELLSQVVSFLRFPVKEDRLTCAFQIADSPRIHRKQRAQSFTTSSQVFSLLDTAARCRLWELLIGFAQYFKYSLEDLGVDHSNCTNSTRTSTTAVQ